ncbi:uncharacterized protein LOC143150432 [Ptiloglossa arizonensis]|uniref:uncharacterized protein LOC143150432 n=1 Tax=Ptiloglossa arizonensis TaxID=3350558 RepID=UPI003FA16E04
MHTKVIKFLNNFKTMFILPYSILLVLSIMCQSICLFRLTQSIFLPNEIEETLMNLMFIFSIFSYMFYLNYIIQQTLDCGNNIFMVLYNTEWYKMSLSTQKTVLFIMLRCSRAIDVNMLFVYKPSMEGFLMMLKTSISYCMVIYSSH